MGRTPEQTFSQRRDADGQQAYEEMLNITTIREMQIKTAMRQHFTLTTRMAIIKKFLKRQGLTKT